MKHRGVRNILTFLLALVLTVAAVSVLSAATRMPEDPPQYRVQEAGDAAPADGAAQMTASIPKSDGTSVLAGLGGFLPLLAIPVTGILLYCRGRRKGRDYREEGGHRRYSPRADMALSGTRFVKN